MVKESTSFDFRDWLEFSSSNMMACCGDFRGVMALTVSRHSKNSKSHRS